MAKELENIANVTSVGDLPHKMEEAEIAKAEVEAKILERVSILLGIFRRFTYVYIFRTLCWQRRQKNGNSVRRR